MFTEFNLYFGMVNVFLPFMILPLYSVDAHARSRASPTPQHRSGAGPVYTFTRVTLPFTMPGRRIAGVSLVFAITVASYVTPSLLIGDRFMTIVAGDGEGLSQHPRLPAWRQHGGHHAGHRDRHRGGVASL